MANQLRRVGELTATFEVFEVYLDPADDRNFFEDPLASIRDLIEAEGGEINSLAMDEVYLKNGGSGLTGTPPPPPTVWHCVAPPEKKSKYITIVQEGEEVE